MIQAICYPHPDCPDKEQCARHNMHFDATKDFRLVLACVPIDAMPYRVEGQTCKWFVQRIENERA